MKTYSVSNPESWARLWIHEVWRVFSDRLIDEEGRTFFKKIIDESLKLKWRFNWAYQEVIFSNLLKLESDEQFYEEIISLESLNNQLENQLFEYNISHSSKMDLVIFINAVKHICKIVRVLLQPRGNAMLIGVSGCGKQSLTRLALFRWGLKISLFG